MKPTLDIERLTAYALGELEPEEAQAIDEALKTAPEARKILEELEATAELARSALQAAPQTAALTDRQRATVMEQAESPAPPETTARSSILRHVFAPKTASGALVRAAAMLLCLVGLYWVANRALVEPPRQELAKNAVEIPRIPVPGAPQRAESEPAEPDAQPLSAPSATDAGDHETLDWLEEDWGAFETIPSASSSGAAPSLGERFLEELAEALEHEVELEPEPEPGPVAQTVTEDWVALPLALPERSFMGTPLDYWSENLEFNYKSREPFMAPAGTELLSLGKPVTSSDPTPSMGTLAMITNGAKGFEEKNLVELAEGLQWVQIDLGEPCSIHAIVVWHYHMSERVYFDVSVHIADDADFTQNVRTLFNNDHDNSSGLGAGEDKEYVESNEGRLIGGHGEIARYVRLYSNGNTANQRNHYIEVEVWGLPGEGHCAVVDARRETAPLRGETLSDGQMVLPIELPERCYMGTPWDGMTPPNFEWALEPRAPFVVPVGTELLSLGKPVTSSDPTPSMGTLAMITDGDKSYEEKSQVELDKGLQWVQIDLGQLSVIEAVVVWHYYIGSRIYHDVSAHIADDPGFTRNARILYNNDYDNSAGFGVGEDKTYIECHEGRLIDGHGEIARYVRLYSNGSTASQRNHYIEVEVWGLPDDADSVAVDAGEKQARLLIPA